MTGLNEVLAVYLMAAKEVSQSMTVSQLVLSSGRPSLPSRWGGGAVQHGAPPPGLGLHQPLRHHREQGRGVGGPPPPTLRGAAPGVEGQLRDTTEPGLQHQV